ncbi:triacylglycerol lipase [Cupriavidus basilensis OR16]|uniref:Triacylglycerol lipase n=1 Tax=Cupriavidus basilensis OR16 TaxID=1127483 RepID=H1SFT0_9BURK|nr:hypothetical protein [Cupriavidus basilensis]EHP38652.1 triacylglycerol lipase [Cupriavidus basilensis OR16]
MKRNPRFGARLCAPILAGLLAVAMPAMGNVAQGAGQASVLSMDERALGLDAFPGAGKPASSDAGADGARLLVGMSPTDVALATAIGKPREAGGMTDAVLALIDGIGQVPLAGPALITLIAGVANVIGWYQGVAEDRPLYHDSLTLPATSSPQV